jgi:hypothetical protein
MTANHIKTRLQPINDRNEMQAISNIPQTIGNVQHNIGRTDKDVSHFVFVINLIIMNTFPENR